MRGEELPGDRGPPHEERSAERVQGWHQGGHEKKEHTKAQRLHGGNRKPAWLGREGKRNRNCRATPHGVLLQAAPANGSRISWKLDVMMISCQGQGYRAVRGEGKVSEQGIAQEWAVRRGESENLIRTSPALRGAGQEPHGI